jgi:hypothetical protein
MSLSAEKPSISKEYVSGTTHSDKNNDRGAKGRTLANLFVNLGLFWANFGDSLAPLPTQSVPLLNGIRL